MSKPKKRQLKGSVVSDKMDKTIIIKTEGVRTHSKYHKQYKVSKKYKVHDPKNEFKTGDIVVFEETRPLSKDKRWKVVTKH
ncbi:30S ribosomal protein S17 [Patescibacteria group bacterium]|nr:30S ribosomal protein S17 [Patescibacteria group bacterium]MBU0963775.1 30S ribosomal protein S17 [Patescibacteria group bacterium]